MVRPIEETDSRCYVKLTERADPDEVEKLFSDNKEIIPVINDGTPGQYFLEPLNKTYFNTGRGMTIEASRDKTDLLIALIIGLMIIGVASFNYLGILTNKYFGKIKEFQVRRINGNSLFSLVIRFMLENSIVIIISFLLSLLLIQEVLPFFNQLTGSTITNNFIFKKEQVFILLTVVVFILFLTLAFAFYLLYRNLNLHILKTWQNLSVRSIQIPAFNIFQVACSAALIVCSMGIIRQINFITDRPVGLNKKVIEIKIPGEFRDKAGVFREELMKSTSVENVSVVGASPLLEHFLVSLHYQDDGIDKQYVPAGFSGDENYLDVLGIELIEGNGFSEVVSANVKKCIVNQSFARFFSDRDLIGRGMPGMEDMIITGIVNDFHYLSLKSYVEPAFISFDDKGGHLLVKPRPGMESISRDHISATWKDLIPDYPVNKESVGDRYEWYHRNNKNYIRLIGSCSFVSLFLSMIGLFAISFQKARSRTKEIGIRKINGASLAELLFLINKDFFRWIVISFLIAWPVSWYAMNRWLGNYAYKTTISWWIFAFSAIIVITVTLLTVSWQSWRAATRNPVDALRYE